MRIHNLEGLKKCKLWRGSALEAEAQWRHITDHYLRHWLELRDEITDPILAEKELMEAVRQTLAASCPE